MELGEEGSPQRSIPTTPEERRVEARLTMDWATMREWRRSMDRRREVRIEGWVEEKVLMQERMVPI
jgi:hypothetical protein